MKIEVNISKKIFFAFVGLFLILGGVLFTFAYNSNFDSLASNAQVFGHSADETVVKMNDGSLKTVQELLRGGVSGSGDSLIGIGAKVYNSANPTATLSIPSGANYAILQLLGEGLFAAGSDEDSETAMAYIDFDTNKYSGVHQWIGGNGDTFVFNYNWNNRDLGTLNIKTEGDSTAPGYLNGETFNFSKQGNNLILKGMNTVNWKGNVMVYFYKRGGVSGGSSGSSTGGAVQACQWYPQSSPTTAEYVSDGGTGICRSGSNYGNVMTVGSTLNCVSSPGGPVNSFEYYGCKGDQALGATIADVRNSLEVKSCTNTASIGSNSAVLLTATCTASCTSGKKAIFGDCSNTISQSTESRTLGDTSLTCSASFTSNNVQRAITVTGTVTCL